MADEELPQVPKAGGNKMLLIAVLAFNVLTAAGLGYLVMTGRQNHAEAGAAAHGEAKGAAHGEHGPEAFGPLIEIGSLVSNLKGGDVAHYMKVAVWAEAANEEAKKVVEGAVVPLRAEALLYLSGLTVDDTSNGDRIKLMGEELTKRAQEMVGKEHIKRIYISEFVIQ